MLGVSESPQFTKALAFLQHRSDAAGAGVSLPAIGALATECEVAYVTMWKAVDQLRRRGVLDVRPRRGIVVTHTGLAKAPVRADPSPESIRQPRTRGRKWYRTAMAIQQDLLRGYHSRAAPLPSFKELAERYGVCQATLSKALRWLTHEGVVEQRRMQYYPATTLAGRGRNTVVLVASSDAAGNLNVTHPRVPEYLRALEHCCSLKNVGLSLLPYDAREGQFHDTGTIHRLRTDPSFRGSLLGILVWQAGIDTTDWTELVRRLAPLGTPMALLDESGELRVPHITGSGNRIRLYTLGWSAVAGRCMGRHLLDLGHRRIAYISPLHRSSWSRNRLAGVRAVFTESGMPDAVREFVLDHYSLPVELGERSRIVRDELTQTLAHIPIGLSGEQRTLSERTRDTLQSRLDAVLQREAYALSMQPLMEAALADHSITAWVAADDDTALPCLEFLRRAGKRVPRDISVVGFDDSLEGSLHKLTSYNYNGDAYMRAMLAHVLNPACPESGGRGGKPVEIDGTLVVRRTSGPPHRESRPS